MELQIFKLENNDPGCPKWYQEIVINAETSWEAKQLAEQFISCTEIGIVFYNLEKGRYNC